MMPFGHNGGGASVSGRKAVPTRRAIVLGTIATGIAVRTGRALAKASQPATPVNFDVPAGACDCHTHIFSEPEKFPFFAGRVYTPETALPKELGALHQSLHIERVVIVTPSVYGTDNAATLAGMKARGAESRGVAVIDDKTPESELDAMHGAGVRGIRINLATGNVSDPALARSLLETAIDRVKGRSWHIQIYADLRVIAALNEQFAASPVPLVFDHFAGAQAALGLGQPGFADVLDLVRSGRAYVKISGAYRASKAAPDYSDVVPLAKALIAANPDRIVWGTDWPHPDSVTPPGKKPTDVTPLLQIDDGRLLNLLPVWAPDVAIREKILVANPARLYGFAQRR
jgi:predicted TIM-barrel fold metal-dependent hydrolase